MLFPVSHWGGVPFKKVLLLIGANGADASQSFTDESSYARTLTAFNNAQIDTAQSKYGGSSALCDGASDCITMPYSSEMNLATRDFTVECWMRPAATSAQADILSQRQDSGETYDANSFLIYRYGTTMQAYLSSNGSSWDVASGVGFGTVAANTWYHLALVRKGTAFTAYLNGVGTAIATSSASIESHSVPFRVAINRVNEYFSGHLDEIRFVGDLAVYTRDFTPVGPFPRS